jgi:hypothetical protein
MRSLVTWDIDHLWTELDGVIREELYRIRGRCGPDFKTRRQIDDMVIALPIRLRSLGLHSHHISAPMAKAAADDLADSMLAPIVPDVNPPEKITSQKERCLEDHLAADGICLIAYLLLNGLNSPKINPLSADHG